MLIRRLLLVGLALAACSPQAPQGTQITVRLHSALGEGGPAVANVVYQIGDGPWKLARQVKYGLYTFNVPPGETRYGVAADCIPPFFHPFGTHGSAYVYQLTTSETTELTIPCLHPADLSITQAQAIRVERDPGDPENYPSVRVYSSLESKSTSLDSEVALLFEAKPDRELLIVAYEGSRIRRIRFVRNLDASNPPVCPRTEPCIYTLSSDDAPAYGRVNAFSKPNWATDAGFFMGFASRQGILINPMNFFPLGQGNEAGGEYALVPGAGAGELYLAEAHAESGVHSVRHLVLLGPEGGDPSFALPERFDPEIVPTALPTFTGLNYTNLQKIGYRFITFVPAPSLSGGFLALVFVSNGWLGNADRYTLPDLSSAPGFRGTKPLSGERVLWQAEVVMASQGLQALLAADPLPTVEPLPRRAGAWVKLASEEGEYLVP